jgi:hypothetical protein
MRGKSNMFIVSLLIFILIYALDLVQPTYAADITCLDTSDTLEKLIGCIKDFAPWYDPETEQGYFDVNPPVRKPSTEELSHWRTIVSEMLNGSCEEIDLRSLTFYRIAEFTDVETGKTYCVAMEVEDTSPEDNVVDRGFGTIIVYPFATRNLVIQVPHPKYEYNTAIQGANIFKNTYARVFLMAGTHRKASSNPSTCQQSYKELDVAHNTDNFFFYATLEIESFYSVRDEDFRVIQFHGMGKDDCQNTDVFITYGVSESTPPEGDFIDSVRDNLLIQQPTWNVEIIGEGSCNLKGTHNVEGRFLNGVSAEDVCDTYAATHSGRFIHIEQKHDKREEKFFDDWVWSISNVLPVLTVIKQGQGDGVITSTPEGIDCGTDCHEQYDPDIIVTLHASPLEGSIFTGWSGNGCSGIGECIVTMNSSDIVVTATFELCENIKAQIGDTYYTSLQEAYNDASDGDTIKVQALTITEDLDINRDIKINIEGGYSCDFHNITGLTLLNGTIHIYDGEVRIGGFYLQ